MSVAQHHVGALAGQDDRNTNPGADSGIYQSYSGLLSVFSRTTQLFQELLFKLRLFKSISNKFENFFKPNYKFLVENIQPNAPVPP